jgi:predicted  nucleic acid-binding Zn-ribbon protein
MRVAMSEHDRQADRLEREMDDMEQQSERLGDNIDETRKDWEAKKQDPSVPGATADRDADGDDEPPPEQQYPAKGD